MPAQSGWVSKVLQGLSQPGGGGLRKSVLDILFLALPPVPPCHHERHSLFNWSTMVLPGNAWPVKPT